MSVSTPLRARHVRRWSVSALIAALLICLPFALSDEHANSQTPAQAEVWPEIQLRIAWGGGEPRRWRGRISVSRGQIIQKRLLGIESDEPGAIWQHGAALAIEQPRPRTYDGVDATVRAPLDATLMIDLNGSPGGGENRTPVVQIPLREMVANYYNGQLDELGNRLLVRRESGDILRVELDQPAQIFESGSTIRARLQPYLLPAAAGSQIQVRISVTPAREGDELWSERRTITLDAAGTAAAFPVEFDAPVEEGAYDLHVEALQSGFGARLGLKQTIAERRLQFLVLGQQVSLSSARPEVAWTELSSFELAKEDWWFNLARWPLAGGSLQPQSSGHRTTVTFPMQSGNETLTSLELSTEDSVCWESVPLKLDDPGKPHIVEVEYPADAPQILGISIMEPNAAGRLVPIGLDSGVYTPQSNVLAQSGKIAVHRLVFWPRTERPLLLITNQSTRHPCYFGKIRLLSGPDHLPADLLRSESPLQARRQWLAYFEKPLLSENFGATEFIDEWSGRSLDDWKTFHQAVTRLGEYLSYRGNTGAIITVATDGSALFPSKTLTPTPRFDTGAFFDASPDPHPKDVMELLLREFDRRELKMIPALDFASRIPDLEQLARGGDPSTASLFWIGGKGRWLPDSHPPDRGRAPYYNILDPRVQEAMLSIILETARRAARHPSFDGLAIRLGADGYAQLPGADWGFDDLTVARFERETGIDLAAGTGPDRFIRRKEVLLSRHLSVWLAWRADQLRSFYRRAAAQLRQIRPDAVLYLLGTGVLAKPSTRSRFHPLSTEPHALARTLLEAGIGPDLISGGQGVEFVEPRRVRPVDALAFDEISAADQFLATSSLPKFDEVFRGSKSSVFFHPPHEFRLASFERTRPFEETSAWIVSQTSPSGAWNRQRFAHALAVRDLHTFIDGGWMLPMGQDQELRKMMSVYLRLPDGPFETFAPESTQPVVIRKMKVDDRICCYLVNDSPWRAEVRVRIRSSSDVRAQTIGDVPRSQPIDSQGDEPWMVMELAPYELKGVWLWGAELQIDSAEVELPDAAARVEQRLAKLREGLNRLGGQQPEQLLLDNGDFESFYPNGVPFGWYSSAGSTVTQLQGSQLVREGESATILRSNSGQAYLASEPFPAPKAGRLAVSAWLKIPHKARPPSTRIAIVGEIDGRTYYRYAPVQASEHSAALSNQWRQFVFHVQDLPTTGLTNLRVQFDLMEPGEVAIDDVEVYDNLFDTRELMQISALLTRAKISKEKREWNDCLQMLNGYWPRFLDNHAPLGTAQVAGFVQSSDGEDDADERSGILDQVLPEWIKWR
ncbi:MAG: hypothetical protein MPJ50_12415 [Pirellulales bacterium]|nr:hypothetical protein [Pirellulales bacterium]